MAEKKETTSTTSSQKQPPNKEPTPTTDLDWTWTSPSTWPLSIKFSPVLFAILAAVIGVLFPDLVGNPSATALLSSQSECVRNFNYTYQIAAAKHWAEELSIQSWELGTTAEAILELIHPEKSVFVNAYDGSGAGAWLRQGKVPRGFWKLDESSIYIRRRVRVHDGPKIMEDAFSVADPASLGIAALMIGQHWPGWAQAADRQAKYLLEQAPRYENGAVSHREEVPELWADAMSMFPPFLAFWGMQRGDLSVVRETVRQIGLYRDVLLMREGKGRGLWRHSVGPSEMADPGAWSTSNGWAAYGMLRVRATVAGWEGSRAVMREEIEALDSWVLDILEAAMRTDDDKTGLLRNYLGSDTWQGEGAGMSLLTAAAYRMVMFMEPSSRRDKLLQWADRKRWIVAAHVNNDGIILPIVNPYAHNQELPLEGGSPEAEAFLLFLGAAWRDCVCGGVCRWDGGT